jgi:hypothetical protein
MQQWQWWFQLLVLMDDTLSKGATQVLHGLLLWLGSHKSIVVTHTGLLPRHLLVVEC